MPLAPRRSGGGRPERAANNGFVVLDTSEVQARRPNAKIKHISTVMCKDGSTAQHTIPITIDGKPYVVWSTRRAPADLPTPRQQQVACDAGLTPFPMARIFDISDETKPASCRS